MVHPQDPYEFTAGELMPESLLRSALQACGNGVKVFRGCRLFPPGRISVGDYSQIDELVFVFAGESVRIGRYVHLSIGASITGGGSCFIEDFAGISAGVRIVTGTESLETLSNPTVPAELRNVQRKKVVIKAHALIFTNVVILPGITIGEGAVVSAGSVVHHDLKPWAVYGGFPLVQIGVRAPEPVLAKAALICKPRSNQERAS